MSMIPLATLTFLLADGFDMHSDFGPGWWIVMMLGMLLFWGLIIAAVVWVVRELTHSRATRAGVETPNALLDRRFASGEISAEEYRERKAVLGGEPRPTNGSDT
jgi:putative membrane protein